MIFLVILWLLLLLCDYLKLSPEDFHNWEVRLDGVRFISGSLSYDVSLRKLEKPAKKAQGKPKKQKRPI